MELVESARSFAEYQHRGQLDDDGRPYFWNHVVPVAFIVGSITNSPEVRAAAYLHDVLEDTSTTYDQLKLAFGQKVADLVHEVTHEGTNDNYGYYFPRLKSRDTIMIKLADRLSNISRMDSWDESRREHYLKQTRFWKTGEVKA